nr:Lipase member H [Metisa plana]
MRANMLIGALLLVFLIRTSVSSSIYDLVINAVTCGCNRPTNLNVSECKIYYYNFETNSNASYYIDDAAASIQARSDFDSDQCLHLFIPGFTNNINSTPSNVVRCALANYTCNSKKIALAIIDHSPYLSPSNILEEINYVKSYQDAVKYTKSVSYSLGKFMVSMIQKLGTDNVMASGHSLGGQMVGAMANYTKNEGYTLQRILAIDPAGPCYKDCESEHVKSGQAEEVMAIHCNAGELGSYLNLTDYDAYSGNGVDQDCEGANAIDLIAKGEASSCSHSKCVPIAMQTALQSNIWNATECGSYAAYSSGSCSGNNTLLVGYNKTGDGNEGTYFFEPSDSFTCSS